MLTAQTSLCIILSSMLILAGLWLWKQTTTREGLNKDESEQLVEHTQIQKEEAVHAAGKYDSNRGTARNHAKVMTELLQTLDADMITEMLDYAKSRHKQGNSYALMNKYAAHATAINTLRTSCETAMKVVQAA